MTQFETTFTPSRSPDAGAAFVVYGLNPIPGQMDRTVATLAEDNNVFAYTYGNEVVTDGDPAALPALIGAIEEDVLDKTSEVDPERIRIAGASLGAFIGYNIQRQLGLQLPGLYAAAGVNVARNMMYNPIFYPARKAFLGQGHDLKAIDEAWSEIDIYADRPGGVPFVCVINRLDPVVPYPFANHNLKEWQQAGERVEILRSTAPRFEGTLLHTATISRFNSGIREILEISKTI